MRLRVIRDLVAFQPAGRRTNLGASLSYASRVLRHRSIVVVLSDFIAEGWERPLRRLGARHEVVAITVDDPAGARAAGVRLDRDRGCRDRTAGVLVDTGSREVRPAGRALAERRREERARTLAASGADHVRAGDATRLRHPAAARLRSPRAPDQSRMMARCSRCCLVTARVPDPPSATLSGSAGRSRPGRAHGAGRRLGARRPGRAARAAPGSSCAGTRPRSRTPWCSGGTGEHTVDLPGPLLLGPGGTVDSLATSR